MSRSAYFVGFLVGLAPCAAALAQEVEQPAAEVLTLDAAIEQALQYNSDVQIAGLRLGEVKAVRDKVTTAYLPNIVAAATYTHNSAEAVFDMGKIIQGIGKNIGVPIAPESLPPPSYIQRFDTLGAVLTLDQPVFAMSPILLMRAADRQIDAQTAAQEATRREIIYQVKQVYYTLAGTERLIQSAQRALSLADQRIANALRRQASGAEGELTVLRAQTERDKAEQDLIRTQNVRQQLLAAIGTLLGADPPTAVSPPPALELPAGDAQAWVQSSMRQRPDLEARRQAVAAAQVALEEAQLRWLPILSIGGRLNYTDTAGFAGKNWLWAVTANLAVPLFDRGLRYADARERRQTQARLNAELSKAQTELKTALRQTELDLRTAEKTLAIALAQAQKAKRMAEIVGKAQVAGAATSLEVAEADTGLRVAESAAERERINLQLAMLKLQHLTGAVTASK